MSTPETLPPPEKMNRALVDIFHVALAWETDLPIREKILKLAQDAIPTTAQIMIHKTLQDRLAEVEKELAGFRNAPVQEQKLCGRFGLKSYLDLENEVSHLGTSLAETRIELAQLKEANAELVKLLEVERKSK